MARILIVDDDHVVCDLLQTTLRFGRHEIIEAGNAAAALEVFVVSPPDVVILDLGLPGGMSGLQLLERLVAEGTRARFVVLTGSDSIPEERFRAAGAAGFLKKPFRPLELIRQLESALRGG